MPAYPGKAGGFAITSSVRFSARKKSRHTHCRKFHAVLKAIIRDILEKETGGIAIEPEWDYEAVKGILAKILQNGFNFQRLNGWQIPETELFDCHFLENIICGQNDIKKC